MIHFTQSAAIQLGGLGVRVNCIAPGNIETEILGNMVGAGLPDDEKAAMMEKVRAFLLAASRSSSKVSRTTSPRRCCSSAPIVRATSPAP